MVSDIEKARQLYEVLELKASTKIENILKNLCVEFLIGMMKYDKIEKSAVCYN